MLADGATFIDVGAYSSRPNATPISMDEEMKRLLPTIALLTKNFADILISTDTFRAKIAQKSVEAGACMINDISGGNLDVNMFNTVAKLQVPYILMHMQGTPQNMQENPQYNHIIKDIFFYFSDKLNQLRDLKVNDVILDIGFGFGKTLDDNYKILKNLAFFKEFELPLLVGTSRKSMLYKLLNGVPKDMLNATTVTNTIALLNRASMLRVQDVKEAKEAITIFNQIK